MVSTFTSASNFDSLSSSLIRTRPPNKLIVRRARKSFMVGRLPTPEPVKSNMVKLVSPWNRLLGSSCSAPRLVELAKSIFTRSRWPRKNPAGRPASLARHCTPQPRS